MKNLYIAVILFVANIVKIIPGDGERKFIKTCDGKLYSYTTNKVGYIYINKNERFEYLSNLQQWYYVYNNKFYNIKLDRGWQLPDPEELKQGYLRKK